MYVTDVNPHGVKIGDEFIAAKTIVWTAGLKASPVGKWLGAETDRNGRVKVLPDLTVPGHANIFVIGDPTGCATRLRSVTFPIQCQFRSITCVFL